MDYQVVELQKQLQRAGYNTISQSGVMDTATRKAIEKMNSSHGWGSGIGSQALTSEGINFLKNFASEPDVRATATAMETLEKNNISAAVQSSSTPKSQSNVKEVNSVSQAVNGYDYSQAVQNVQGIQGIQQPQQIISSPQTGYFPNQNTIANGLSSSIGGMNIEDILGAIFGIVIISGVFSLFKGRG
jgi:peptidoglycan hydrolase-like protein with peptidoglycan-binding domain